MKRSRGDSHERLGRSWAAHTCTWYAASGSVANEALSLHDAGA
jgi:hypothetical protein